MREWCDALIAFLLAPQCAACGGRLASPTRGCVCDSCWNGIVRTTAPICCRCGGQMRANASGPCLTTCASCASRSSAIDTARAIGVHDGTLRTIVHALKYDARRSIAPRLARLMCEVAEPLVAGADAVVPVPLHPARRRSRGFNQAADLARHIGRPVVHALARARNTPTQTALPAAHRAANVAHAFRGTRHLAALHGATVLLVDDVRTTGATLEACGVVLKRGGVARISALTAARVETPGG
jgi:ComF family protein